MSLYWGDSQESMLETGGSSTTLAIVRDSSSTPTVMLGDDKEAASLSVDLHNNPWLLPIAEDPRIQSSYVDFHALRVTYIITKSSLLWPRVPVRWCRFTCIIKRQGGY